MYVDDSLFCGNNGFVKFPQKTLDKFEPKKRDFDETVLAGVRVKRTDYVFELFRSSTVRNYAFCGWTPLFLNSDL